MIQPTLTQSWSLNLQTSDTRQSFAGEAKEVRLLYVSTDSSWHSTASLDGKMDFRYS